MKFRFTILIFVLTVAGAALMSSCTKSYTCQCSIVYTGAAGLPDSTEKVYNITNTASGAKSACSGNSFTHTDPNTGITTTETCALY